jgi:hypothetical protein
LKGPKMVLFFSHFLKCTIANILLVGMCRGGRYYIELNRYV